MTLSDVIGICGSIHLSLRANYPEQHLREWGRLSSLHASLTTGDVRTRSRQTRMGRECTRRNRTHARGNVGLHALSGLLAGGGGRGR